MKKFVTWCAAVLLLAGMASATAAEEAFLSSEWARRDIEQAVELGFARSPGGADYRAFITRGAFAENALYMVGRVFETDMRVYLDVVNHRRALEGQEYDFSAELTLAASVGLLKGRDDASGWDEEAFISRQEAACMLARAYRVYAGDEPEELLPVNFTDQGDIADWAMDDVRLMNRLGVMNGVGDGRFDPLGTFTVEQCLVALLRLYETPFGQAPAQANPFTMTREEVIACIKDQIGEGNILFEEETEHYHIFVWGYGGTMAGPRYYIQTVDQKLFSKKYSTAIPSHYNPLYGPQYQVPENIGLSEDGATLSYTSRVDSDIYYSNGVLEVEKGELLFEQGLYTVALDLSTGEQSYARADLPV